MISSQSFLQEQTKTVLWQIVLDYRQKRTQSLKKEDLDLQKFRQELYQIKRQAIAKIKQLKIRAIKNLEENGISVLEAKDASSAREIIKKILKDKKLIAKAKSNAFNEINKEGFLEDKELIETDLGDFIVSLFEKCDFHPVLPALDLTPLEIVRKIKEKFNQKVKPEPAAITSFVRNFLREKITKAQVGITGANIITACGSILILENEGNISLVSRLPSIHIIISGFEKIVPTLDEALKIVKASAIWGTGQNFPVYLSIISGPSKTADIQNQTIIGAQGAKEVYLILLDNGRSKIIDEGFEELLYCINCGACLNFCPVYQQIGANYGDKYLGSKGVIFAGLTESLKKAVLANCFACTLCSACFENCPVKIDLPHLMRKLRSYMEKNGLQTKENQEMIEKIRNFGNPFGKVDKNRFPDKLYCC